jgi:two-component system sensor histidine kinase CreC
VTLKGRLVAGLVVVVTLGFWFLLERLVGDLEPSHRRSTEEPLVDVARVLAATVAATARDGALQPEPLARALADATSQRFSARIYDWEKTAVDLVVYLTDEKGRVIYDSRGRDLGADFSQKNDVLRTLRGEYGARTTRDVPADENSSVMYVAAPVTIGGKLAGVLTVGKPTRRVNEAVATARDRIASVGTGAGVAIVFLGFVLAALAARPLRDLTEYARAVRDGRKAPPPAGGSSEIRELTRAFEEMREALEGKKYVAHYVETLTHEMKSPLSVLRGAAELLDEEMPPERRRQFLANIRSETARLTDLVEKMLLLSSVEKRDRAENIEAIDAAQLATDVKSSLAPVLEARRLTVEVLSSGPVSFPGERFLARQALTNLVQNAVDFSPDGATIRVVVGAAGDLVEMAVEDSGPGVPAWALDRVFERFFSLERPESGRKSSGLGLAFVREVAQIHGGTASLANAPGGGARARITFRR